MVVDLPKMDPGGREPMVVDLPKMDPRLRGGDGLTRVTALRG